MDAGEWVVWGFCEGVGGEEGECGLDAWGGVGDVGVGCLDGGERCVDFLIFPCSLFYFVWCNLCVNGDDGRLRYKANTSQHNSTPSQQGP